MVLTLNDMLRLLTSRSRSLRGQRRPSKLVVERLTDHQLRDLNLEQAAELARAKNARREGTL